MKKSRNGMENHPIAMSSLPDNASLFTTRKGYETVMPSLYLSH